MRPNNVEGVDECKLELADWHWTNAEGEAGKLASAFCLEGAQLLVDELAKECADGEALVECWPGEDVVLLKFIGDSLRVRFSLWGSIRGNALGWSSEDRANLAKTLRRIANDVDTSGAT